MTRFEASWAELGNTLPSSPEPDAIINARDTMWNLGQTWISYKVGQAHLTQTECDPNDPDELTWF